MRFYSLFILMICMLACTEQPNQPTLPEKPESELPQPYNYQLNTFQNDDGTWGYSIFQDGKKYIHQPYIPAISGKKGFTNEEKARITGEFALTKLKEGQRFPTIDRKELDSLKVLE